MTALAAALRARALPARARALPARAGTLARRVPPRLLGVVAFALVAVGGGLLWLRDSSLVAVRDVRVLGVEGPQAGRIRAALTDAALEQSTLHLDAGALRAAVDSFPLVRDVRVDGRPPHGLTVRVIATRPVAVLAGRTGGRVAVSADGELLRTGVAGVPLPVVPVPTTPVAGPVASPRTFASLAVAAAAPRPLRARLRRLSWEAGRGVVVRLRGGPALYFGAGGRAAAKWVAATRVLADPSSAGAEYVDVRVPERPAAGGVAPDGQSAPAVDPAVPVPLTAPTSPPTMPVPGTLPTP